MNFQHTMKFPMAFLVAAILTTLALPTVTCFIPCNNVLPEQRQRNWWTTKTVRHLASDDVPHENDMDDDYLRRSLQRAKNDMLGAPIPAEMKRERAKKVESEFLAAMQVVTEEFERLKMELGSDGAVDRILKQIDDEDERIEDDDLDSIFQ